jgi:hypothetical protein
MFSLSFLLTLLKSWIAIVQSKNENNNPSINE